MSRRKRKAYRRTEESLEQISVFSVTEVKMKWTRVALAAAVVIACVCFLQTAAVPFTQEAEDEHHVESETPQENEHLTETSHPNPLAFFRVKRQSHLSLCRYCCNCCRNKGCGYCCKF